MITYEFITTPQKQDMSRIYDLYQQAGWWGDGSLDLEYLERLIKGSHCFLLARHQGQAIGMGRAISDRVSDAYIQDVTVESSWRKMGIATSIVTILIERLTEDGLGWIALIAERGTQALYTDLGFAVMPKSTPLLYRSQKSCY